jgi:hypothetical protein
MYLLVTHYIQSADNARPNGWPVTNARLFDPSFNPIAEGLPYPYDEGAVDSVAGGTSPRERLRVPQVVHRQTRPPLGERRYYVLLFSHEFASHFWKAGESITFQVPKQTFQRRMADGSIGIVTRKPYIRRSAREDVWRYHLRELAVAEEPLRYMRRYLRVADDVDPDPTITLEETES